MTRRDATERITALLEPEAVARGFELVAVEVSGAARRPVVRIFLDREGGIDIDSIAKANAWISAALDAEEPVNGSYTLEVSSPGIERPLRTLRDFQRFVGTDASVRTLWPIDGRSRFTGRIEGVDHDVVVLDADGVKIRIPHSGVARARLKPEIAIGHGRGEDER